VDVTVSIGIAVFPEHGTSGTTVLQAAGNALYGAPLATVTATPLPALPPAPAPAEAAPELTVRGASSGAHRPRPVNGR